MATYGDFSSLLQLGVGVGIGLSLFRAPVDLRVAKLMRILGGEITALRGSETQFGIRKRRDMQDLEFGFTTVRLSLERRQLPFMICALSMLENRARTVRPGSMRRGFPLQAMSRISVPMFSPSRSQSVQM